MESDVVVVGSGPTGLALACGLRAAGIAVRLIDAATGPAVTSRALGLQPRGVEVLDRLGALGDLQQHGLPVRRIIITVNGRQLASLEVGEPGRLGGPRGLILSQSVVEHVLRERFTTLGGVIEWGRTVTGVAYTADAVAVALADGATITAEWVIGADGAHSAIRKAAGIGFPGAPLVEGFLLADVHADLDRPRDTVHSFLRPSGPFAAFPLPGPDLWRLMAQAPAGYPADAGADDVVAALGARLAAETGGRVRSAEWTSSFRFQRRLADNYRRGRILLAGDAAHIHSPLGGQGMNTGLGDAENLAWKLALVVSGRADAGLLDTYGAERRPIAKGVLATTSRLTRLVMGESVLARTLRDRVAVPLLNLDWVQRRIALQASQLGVSYRKGPLGVSGRRDGIRPGDRVPDRPCTRPDGTDVRLYQALGSRWALLGPADLADVARMRLGDVVELRGDGEALLVRPDGHLAWRGTDAAELRGWLDATLGARARALTA